VNKLNTRISFALVGQAKKGLSILAGDPNILNYYYNPKKQHFLQAERKKFKKKKKSKNKKSKKRRKKETSQVSMAD
jgi:hypothetical protein